MNTESMNRNLEFVPPQESQNSWGFLVVAWQRKWIILLMVAVGLGLGYLYFLRETPLYESTAQILLVQRQAMLPIQGVEMDTGYDNTHTILIRSPMVAQTAVEIGELKSLPTFSGHPDPKILVMSNLNVSTESRDRTSGDVFQISYKSRSTLDCQKVLNAVVKAYDSFLGSTYKDVSNEAMDFIRKAKDEVEIQIDQAESEYEEFRKTKSSLLYAGQSALNIHEPRLEQIEKVRSAAVLENTQIQAKISAIEAALARGSSREALNLVVGQLQPEADATKKMVENEANQEDPLFTLKLEEQMMLERYGPDHPKVQAVRKRMELMKQYQENLKAPDAPMDNAPKRDFFQVYLESLREQMNVKEQTLVNMTELFKLESAAATSLAADREKDEQYRAEIDRKRRMFDAILKRLEEIDLLKDTSTARLQLIHPPSYGVQIQPDLKKIMLSAGLLGIVAGVGLAYVVDRADRRFRSPDEIRNDLGLPVVGHIPVIPASESEKKDAEQEGDVAKPQQSHVLRVLHHPRGRIAEAYRAVRTALYFSTRGTGHQVIQVTSPSPGDGKTTLACNLAVSIAQSGKKVLLVDCDFRRPRCHRVFGVDNSIGVTSVLDGTSELADMIKDSGIPNLVVLPCGVRPENPSELLTSAQFEGLLNILREKFEFVIVDTPPVLVVTDPLNVVPRVDGVLLVMRLTKSARIAGRRALASLEEVGANMLGVVVNGVGAGPGYGGYGKYGYGKYGYGGYGYGYGYGYGGYGGYGYGGYSGYGGERYGYGNEYRYGYADGDDKSYYEDVEEGPNGKVVKKKSKRTSASNGKRN